MVLCAGPCELPRRVRAAERAAASKSPSPYAKSNFLCAVFTASRKDADPLVRDAVDLSRAADASTGAWGAGIKVGTGSVISSRAGLVGQRRGPVPPNSKAVKGQGLVGSDAGMGNNGAGGGARPALKAASKFQRNWRVVGMAFALSLLGE
jgi:hypothetical protein